MESFIEKILLTILYVFSISVVGTLGWFIWKIF